MGLGQGFVHLNSTGCFSVIQVGWIGVDLFLRVDPRRLQRLAISTIIPPPPDAVSSRVRGVFKA